MHEDASDRSKDVAFGGLEEALDVTRGFFHLHCYGSGWRMEWMKSIDRDSRVVGPSMICSVPLVDDSRVL